MILTIAKDRISDVTIESYLIKLQSYCLVLYAGNSIEFDHMAVLRDRIVSFALRAIPSSITDGERKMSMNRAKRSNVYSKITVGEQVYTRRSICKTDMIQSRRKYGLHYMRPSFLKLHEHHQTTLVNQFVM